MKTKNKITTLAATLFLVSCGGTVLQTSTDKTVAVPQNTVELSDEQIAMMEITVAPAEKMNMAYTVETNGTLELPPQNKASLSAIIGGRVRNIQVIQGDKVKKGQLLATLENPEFITLQQDYLTSRNQVIYLEKEYERAKMLRDQQINSEKSFAKTENEYNDALFKFKGIKTQLELIGIDLKKLEQGDLLSAIPVRSPIDGYIRLIELNLGQYIEPAQSLFEIVDNDHLHLELLVYEKDIARIREGQNVHFYTSSNPENMFSGQLFAVGKAFEKDQKAIKVYADISGPKDHLIPGMYVNGHIELDSNMTTVLPRESLIEEGGLYYVFCQKEGVANTFEKIEVKPGASEGNKAEIIFLNPEDAGRQFVIKGAYYLNAELNKQAE
ncbi:MAG: efflux RND transporter periplasmic adaptor subunit [Bacteroidetes bacterium]|nr:efflux RND transporter periplasmic adaptor subunit [Bacteroidota bacterium]